MEQSQTATPRHTRLPEQLANDVFPAGCPSRTVLDHITSRWGILIIMALSEGEHRWSELRRRADGISEKMLAQTLKTLERDGLVHRKALPVIPPHVNYGLTERGHELADLLIPLVTWAYNNANDILDGQS